MPNPSSDDAARKRDRRGDKKVSEYNRRRYAANREQRLEYQRQYYQENREQERERGRRRYVANREQKLAQARQRYAEDAAVRERIRDYQAAHRPQINDRMREYLRKRKSANPERVKAENRLGHLRHRHGIDGAAWAAMWEAQQGKCRYCQRDLDETAVVEHWHGCAVSHDPGNSCRACRRGLACPGCNRAIGAAGDDPDRLVLIAENLRIANAEVRERQKSAPQQLQFEM